MVIRRLKDIKPFWSSPPHHRSLRVLLSPALNNSNKNLGLGVVEIPPGESGNAHQHAGEQETWYILSGKGKLIIGADTYEVEPDMVITAPEGIPHQILNDGNEILKAIFIFIPAGPEGEFITN